MIDENTNGRVLSYYKIFGKKAEEERKRRV